MPHDVSLTESEQRFAQRMKEVRQIRGISQAQMAKRLTDLGFKMHQTAVAKMEATKPSERRPIRLSEAVAIADILEEEMEDMLFGPMGTADTEPHFQASRQRLDEARATAAEARAAAEAAEAAAIRARYAYRRAQHLKRSGDGLGA
jgi:transcriptional regulator with XRE-family HTH domain